MLIKIYLFYTHLPQLTFSDQVPVIHDGNDIGKISLSLGLSLPSLSLYVLQCADLN